MSHFHIFCYDPYFRQERLSAQPSKYETVSKKGPKMALGGSDAQLVFRKRVYRHVHDIPNDPVEYHLLYFFFFFTESEQKLSQNLKKKTKTKQNKTKKKTIK